MIDINRIYKRVTEELFLKGKGGYISGDQFNRTIQDAQNYLFEFFVQKEKETRRNVDALSPFVVEVYLPVTSGYADLPDDYAHKRDWLLRVQDTNCVGNNLVYARYALKELKSGEYSNLIDSPIRRPDISKNKYAVELVGDQIKIYPEETVGDIYLKYVKTPPTATWAFTLDGSNDQENYDSGNSIDLVWNESEANAIINIMLFLKGVQVRDSDIINWLASTKPITESV